MYCYRIEKTPIYVLLRWTATRIIKIVQYIINMVHSNDNTAYKQNQESVCALENTVHMENVFLQFCASQK